MRGGEEQFFNSQKIQKCKNQKFKILIVGCNFKLLICWLFATNVICRGNNITFFLDSCYHNTCENCIKYKKVDFMLTKMLFFVDFLLTLNTKKIF